MNDFHEYLIQHSLKSGGTKDHFRQIQVPGTAPYWKACILDTENNLLYVFYLGRSRSPSPKVGRKGKSDSPTPNTDLGKGKLTVNDLSKDKKALRINVSVWLVTETQSCVKYVLHVVRCKVLKLECL